MKNMTKNKFVQRGLVALSLLAMPVVALAASLNTAPNDLPTIQVANGTLFPNTQTAWSSSASVSGGQILSVQIYYHNTGADTAQNVIARLTMPSGQTGPFSVSGSVSASNANTSTGSAQVTFSDGQPHTLTYNAYRWYPDQPSAQSSSPRPLINGQSGQAALTAQGLSLGNVPPNEANGQWTFSQGTVVVDFLVSQTAPQSVCPASATTNQPTGVTQTSANFSGSVSPSPTNSFVSWFEVSTNSGFSPLVTSTAQRSTAGTNFNDGTSALQAGTTYFVRAVVRSSDTACSQNFIYGNPVQFVTQAPVQQGSIVPQTNPASNITQTSALLNGSVTSQGTPQTYEYWFEWGTSALTSATTRQTTTGSVGASQTISGLASDTVYNFRMVGQIAGQTPQYGATLSFRTLPTQQVNNTVCPTSVTTSQATSVTQTSANFYGYVNQPSGGYQTWFEYGTGGGYGQQTSPVAGGGTSFNAYAYNLVSNTYYTVRAVVRSLDSNCSQTTNYGNPVGFTTQTSYVYTPPVYVPPVYYPTYYPTYQPQATLSVTTNSATNVSTVNATVNGSVYANNATSINRWFEYGTTYSLGQRTSGQYQSSGSSNYSDTIYNLSPNTLYYFRAAASSNETGTIYGSILSFSTSGTGFIQQTFYSQQLLQPAVNTNSATNITTSSARLNANAVMNNIQSNGWFEYGTTPALGRQTGQLNLGATGANSYFNTVTGLTSRTLYYFRAVTQNAQGQIARGQILTFTTLAPATTYVPPVVVAKPKTPVVTVAKVSYQQVTSGEVITKTVENLSFPCGTTKVYVCAREGHTVQYTIKVMNPSWTTVSNAVVTDTISPFLAFKSASEDGVYNAGTRVVQWSRSLGPREGHTFTIQVLARDIADNVTVGNNAQIFVGEKTYKSNNTEVCITLEPVRIEINSDKTTVSPGDSVTHTIRYTNVVDSPVTNLLFRMPVPQGTILAGSDRQNLQVQGGEVIIPIGSLNPDQSGTLALTFKINAAVTQNEPIVFAMTANFEDKLGVAQPELTAYTFTPISKSSTPINSANVAGAGSGLGLGGFLPTSLLGWLALILLLLIVALIIMRLVTDYKTGKKRPPETV